MRRIRDVYPGSEIFPPGSRIKGQKFRIRIRMKEFKLTQKMFLSSRNPGFSSRRDPWIQILIFYPSWIRIKKATLKNIHMLSRKLLDTGTRR